MHDVTETDFAQIAAELRRASIEASQAAQIQPERGDDLHRKALHLARTAARIQADAYARRGFIMPNPAQER
jgi:hypothetical protein